MLSFETNCHVDYHFFLTICLIFTLQFQSPNQNMASWLRGTASWFADDPAPVDTPVEDGAVASILLPLLYPQVELDRGGSGKISNTPVCTAV